LWSVDFNILKLLKLDFFEEILMYYLGIKTGYSSPQTLTDQSTAIKRGQKGDLQVLRPHIMCCVPV
jgi:long-chain acyl-CoA synthetase